MITATTNFQNALAPFLVGQISIAIEVEGYGRVFTKGNDSISGHYPWITEISDYSYSINDTEGGADQGNFSFTVMDFENLITADFPSFVFEGKVVTVKVGLPGLDYSDWCIVFTGYIDTVSSADNNLSYLFSCLDVTGYLAQVVYQTGDDGSPTSSSNFHTLNAHPLDIFLDILLNQVKIDPSQVDVETIQAYRDGPYSGMQFLFKLDQPVAAADFIMNQLLKPLGAYMFVGDNQISMSSFLPLAAPVGIATFGPDSWTSIPMAEQTGSANGAGNPLINLITWQFDKDDLAELTDGSTSYNSTDVQEFAPSLARYGINNVGELTITADGMRSAFQGFFLAAVISYYIFLQYGFKTLIFDNNAADCFFNKLLIESGDFVYVTHPDVPDRVNGVMGITNKLFKILNKNISFDESKITFTMIDASYLQNFGFYKIAHSYDPGTQDTPTPAYASASPTQKANYMFECNADLEYSNGDAAHQLD